MTSHIRALGWVLFGGIGVDGSLGRSHGGISVYGVAWDCASGLRNFGETSSGGKRNGVFTVAFICSSLESIIVIFFRIDFSHLSLIHYIEKIAIQLFDSEIPRVLAVKNLINRTSF